MGRNSWGGVDIAPEHITSDVINANIKPDPKTGKAAFVSEVNLTLW